MQAVFNNISDDLKALITPLKPGETATYRLMPRNEYAVEEMPDGRTQNRLLAPPTAVFSATATIYDPYSQQMVELMASAGTRRTKEGLEPVEDDITFKQGVLVVRHNQPELYRFLELHPANKDCVTPGNEPVKTLFERVQPAKAAKSEAAAAMQGIQAAAELATYSHDELKRVAQRLRVDSTGERDALFVLLSKMAQADGERVFNAIGERAVKVESLASAAVSEGVLEWVGDERLYKLADSRKNFLPVPHGDPETGLVLELMEPRFATQRAMLERLVEAKQKATAKKK